MGNEAAIRFPELSRRFRLWKYQWVGIPLLLTIPVLGFFGTFDEVIARSDFASGPVSASAEYFRRTRHGNRGEIKVRVENRSSDPVQALEVAVDADFLSRFAEVAFSPPAPDGSRIPLGTLSPGESRLVTVKVRADHSGHHSGIVSVRSAPGLEASARIESLVLP